MRKPRSSSRRRGSRIKIFLALSFLFLVAFVFVMTRRKPTEVTVEFLGYTNRVPPSAKIAPYPETSTQTFALFRLRNVGANDYVGFFADMNSWPYNATNMVPPLRVTRNDIPGDILLPPDALFTIAIPEPIAFTQWHVSLHFRHPRHSFWQIARAHLSDIFPIRPPNYSLWVSTPLLTRQAGEPVTNAP